MLKKILLTIILILVNIHIAFAEVKNDTLIKFVALSDVQLTFRNQDNSRRLFKDSEKLFDDAINQINQLKDISFIIVTGDMVDSASESDMIKFIQQADKLKFPWYPVLGNHDVAVGKGLVKKRLIQLFNEKSKGMKNGKTYYSFSPNSQVLVIVLDGTTDQQVTCHGNFDKTQLNWLKQQLDSNKNKLVIIASHYAILPPVKSATHYILEPSRTQLYNLINQYSNVALVLSGHYHYSLITKNNHKLYVCNPPIIEYPNAFRIITVKENGDVQFQWKETTLKALQKKSKSRSAWALLPWEAIKDKNVILNWKK